MAATKKRRDAGGSRSNALGALNHPWRVRIMEVLSERAMSCAQFIDEGLIEELVEVPRDDAISLLAYHFRLLQREGLIEIVEMIPKRGSHLQICRARIGSHHTDEEWAKLSPQERQAISPITFHSVVARAEGAMIHGTFDARIDRHQSWLAMTLDERGWSELSDLLNGILEAVVQLNNDAGERLDASGQKPIRVTWAQLGFESPPLPQGD